MTKKQLRALEALPDVIDALVSLAADASQLHAAMAKASGLGVLTQGVRTTGLIQQVGQAVTPPTPPEAPGYSQTYSPTAEEDEPPYKKRQKAMLATLRNDPRRQEALAQFRHDGPAEDVASG